MKESEFVDWLVKSGRQENSAKSVVSGYGESKTYILIWIPELRITRLRRS